jgi:hypothetical protein
MTPSPGWWRRTFALTLTLLSTVCAVTQAQVVPPGAADPGWPRTYATVTGGRITVYQPQISSWPDQQRMLGYAAVSYAAKGVDKPELGTIKIEAATQVSLEQRLVYFANLRIVESSFHSLSRDQVREVVSEITAAFPEAERIIALDRILANIDQSAVMEPGATGLRAEPPAIFFSTKPAVLVNLDGEPIWSPIANNDLRFAVNTNWDLFQHAPTHAYYLRDGASWLKAAELGGVWRPAGKLPASFSALPMDDWPDVRAAVPGQTMGAPQVPQVFVSERPAELIVLQGEPTYRPVTGTELLWVSNTESDVFRMGRSGPVYYLITGRWFAAPDFTGPWTFATPTLPVDFKRIPLEHPRARVLASVPGTTQAAEAVLLAQVPQIARVDRNQLKPPDVAYQGAAEFVAIEGTSVQRAVNTDKDIIRVGNEYYMCYQAVWFVAPGPTGPWIVASSVPASIYQIPPSSPAHHVTYVVVEPSPTTQYVTVRYTAGYTGVMIGWGCAVWGSGYYYSAYVYPAPYPIYYPYPRTYGSAAWYNPWTGTFGRTAVAYGPYGGIGATARYNPTTGRYVRGTAAWGPYGAAGFAQAWNPRTGTYAQTRQGSNIYGSWGSSYVQRGDEWAQTSRVTNRVTGTTTRVTRTDDGAAITKRNAAGGSGVAVTKNGDIYAGHDGNVYKREGGSWQKYEDGNWSAVGAPAGRPVSADENGFAKAGGIGAATTSTVDPATYDQLERDSGARADGAKRSQAFDRYRSEGGRRKPAGRRKAR